MSAAVIEATGAELEAVEGGMDWGCLGLFTAVGAVAGSPAGPVGAALGAVAGFAAGLSYCD